MKKIHNNCKETKCPHICYQMWGLRTFCEIVLAKTSIASPGERGGGYIAGAAPPAPLLWGCRPTPRFVGVPPYALLCGGAALRPASYFSFTLSRVMTASEL